METLTILHQAEDSAAVTTGHPSTQTPRTITPIDPYRPVSARFLSPTERETIADLHRAGQGVRSIARVLGRSPGTVSKELS
ncbi:MAG: helix-turn-helix domain-containing protein, partial [Corynebacterium variabile]|nr:helix-turn-helix domain-containing protein [Corynebacterium variabile]